MDFVAIDFETANRQANSACQLAAVVVRDSQIVAEHSWLIRPPRMYFSSMNIAIHGIRPEDVRNSPTMEAVWSELEPLLSSNLVIAHNARFDIGVLVNSLAAFDVACPSLEFHCTRSLARAAWPGKASYGLKPLGNWLGIHFKHHDALEDSRCCAKIALTIARGVEQSDVAGLEAALRIRRGHYAQGVIRSPRMLARRGAAKESGGTTTVGLTDRRGFPTSPARRQLGGVDAGTVVAAAGNELPFAGKRIVMLGPLRGLDAEQTTNLLQRLGAEVQSAISAETDLVVACGTSLDEANETVQRSQSMVVKESAPTVATKRAGIRVLSERQFRLLLPAGQASVRW
jgi:DNA polymerase III subunit epsilon